MKKELYRGVMKTDFKIKPGMTYCGYHIPTSENWVILGIDKKNKKVCAAGWPPTIANLEDIIYLREWRERTTSENEYVTKQFGMTFLN